MSSCIVRSAPVSSARISPGASVKEPRKARIASAGRGMGGSTSCSLLSGRRPSAKDTLYAAGASDKLRTVLSFGARRGFRRKALAQRYLFRAIHDEGLHKLSRRHDRRL